MAFDIRNLFGPGALNMLLQPTNGKNAQNLLMQMPDVSAPPIVAGPQPDPMTTAALAGPAPQPMAAAPQVAGGGGRETMSLVLDPAKKQFLQDMFLGWAAGATPEQSLALGAAQAVQGKSERGNQNQTVEWLKGKGMDEQGARMLAGNPKALGDYLQQINKPKEPQKPIEVNGQLVDPTTYKVIGDFRTPATATGEQPTALMRELQAAGLKPGTPEYQEAILANNRPKGMMIESDGQGGFKMVQGTDVSGGANMNVEQGKNTGFLLRAQDADKVITNLESQGTSVWNNTAGQAPLIGNFLRSDDAQKYDQAKRDFINAQLRQESGAVISPEEFKNAEVQYFPQPGDSPAVIEQKRANRQNAVAGFKIRSGPGAQSVDKMGQSGPQSDPLGIR